MIPEGTSYHVRLRFSPKVAHNVSEVQWHHTQKITWNKDDSLDINFRVDGLGEISWWILGYGREAVVQEPPELRRLLAEQTQAMAAQYDGDRSGPGDPT